MIEVPMTALAVPGEGDQMVEPAVGETVEVMLTGKIESVGNGTATIIAESVNGEPVTYSDAAKKKGMGNSVPNENDMRRMAMEADGDEENSMI